MARADRRSVRTRTRAGAPKAATAGKKANVNVEDTLFFSRIRNHAKWVFVFLAITFAHASDNSIEIRTRANVARTIE